MRKMSTQDLFRIRGVAAYLFVVYLLATAGLLFWQGRLLWPMYAVVVAGIALAPVLILGDFRALPPFEVLLICAAPFTLRAIPTGFIASHTLSYLAAGTVAILVFAELEVFTSFETTHAVTVPLVMMTTIATAGIWAVSRHLADVMLGTQFLTSEYLLMWEFTLATLTGILGGEVFSHYIRRLPHEVPLA